MTDSVLIIAGENSGEKYGADLIRQHKKLNAGLSFFGIGGKRMAEEGAELLFTVEDLAVMGVFEILSQLLRIKKIFNRIKKEIRIRRPLAAVLIDSPDFNLRLAKKLKNLSIPVLYYISPTVWAWRQRRIRTIKKTVKTMMLIFPFEEALYEKHNIPAVYIGHPLKEKARVLFSKEEFLKKYGLDPQKKLIALLPGSRKGEIKYHLPVLLEALPMLHSNWNAQFLLLWAESLGRNILSDFFPLGRKDLTVLTEDHYEALAACDLALSACGTANLEAALLETPIVAFYRISPLTCFFVRRLFKIKNFSIVNILAGKKVIPELIQTDFSAEALYAEAKKILDSEQLRAEMKAEFRNIKTVLGDKIASQNAAMELDRLIRSSQRIP